MTIEKDPESGAITCTGEGVTVFNLLAIKSALRLEKVGLKHSQGSVRKRAKELTGLKTNDFDKLIEAVQKLADEASERDRANTARRLAREEARRRMTPEELEEEAMLIKLDERRGK